MEGSLWDKALYMLCTTYVRISSFVNALTGKRATTTAAGAMTYSSLGDKKIKEKDEELYRYLLLGSYANSRILSVYVTT